MLATEAMPGGWRTEPRPADFFSAKALLEAVLAVADVDWRVEEGGPPFLHPGRAARCWPASTRSAGSASCTRRSRAAWDLGGSVAGFELDVDALVALAAGEEPRYHDVTSFPAVLQDIAVGVPVEVSAAAAADTIRSAAGELLASVELFDVYSGDQVGEAKKSLAFRLRFQAPDRTLTDEEVAERRAAIEAALSELGGQLRA